MAKFTKRHYEAIADIFNALHRPGFKLPRGASPCHATLHFVEGELSRLFELDSPRYDKRKFYGRIDKGRGF